MPLCHLMSYYYGAHDHPECRYSAIVLEKALEWVLCISSPIICGYWVFMCRLQEKFHQMYCNNHTDCDVQWHYKVLPRHATVVLQYPIVVLMSVELSFSCSSAFLSHHIIKEVLCKKHFQEIVITDLMLFWGHQTVPRFLFNHSGTEIQLVTKN